MKATMITLAALLGLAAAADTAATLIGQKPKDVGPGKVVAVAAANMTASPQAFTVKSVTVAGTKAHTNTVASATVTNTVTLAKGEWLLPGTVVWAEGAGSTNAAVWVYVER